LKQVKSGIAFDQIPLTKGDGQKEQQTESRAARVLLAGADFLADAYDLFVINLVLRLLRNHSLSHSG
jgi:hypothetical protein